jgi:hypothetical protein
MTASRSLGPFDWVERAAVLASARLADHPLVVPAADVALRVQILTTRVYRRATTVVWHMCGVATFDELGMIGEQLASLRHRIPAPVPGVRGR